MAAASAMLDEIHGDLPRQANDSNTYTLGSIRKHNVVIACLPTAQYGTNSAVNVSTNLTRTFPSIRLGFMVGIGGGVPSKADIRLGDIVVGTRVMQHDLGKVVGDGQIQPTAIPKTLQPSLGTVVSTLRSKHELEPGQVPSILREKLGRHSEYGRPSSPDRLFQAAYKHESTTPGCDGCDQSKLVPRCKRMSDEPMIHYGAIASGNQVMRDGSTRDDIAQRLDVICFEMEAAGLMDVLPCLPIRGICDYSDSHKNKEWQRYAAATAAAYARELLDVLPRDLTSRPNARCQQQGSIWKDGYNHGFQLEKVPLINYFVGRHEYITDMESCLLPEPKLSRRKIYIVCGLGGMGKTQLAVEFARRHQETYSSIFFIDGSSKDALLQSFIRIFRRVAIMDIDDARPHSEADDDASSTPDGITAKALDWFLLEGNNRWLLIYDNVDLQPTDPGGFALDDFFPAKDCGSIIITTRLASLPIAATVKRLGELDAAQSIELLIGTLSVDRATRVGTYPGSRPGAQAAAKLKLVEYLGGLPLAISQAGKLMKSLGVDIEEYLELYKNSKRKVMNMLPLVALPNDPDRASIRTTWTASVNILKQRMADEPEAGPHRCAYRLLHLFAYFDPTDFDYELLKNGKLVNDAPAWVSKVFESKPDFYSTVKILLDLSLIDKTNSNGVYSMHRVVFDWLCTYEAHETEAELLNVAAAAIAWACPVAYVSLEWAESQQRLILHANVLGPRLHRRSPAVRPVWYGQLSNPDLALAAELWECDMDTLRHSVVYQPIGDIARLLSAGGKPQEALALVQDSIAHTFESSPERDISYYVLLYEKATVLQDLSLVQEANVTLLETLDGFHRLQNSFWIVCGQVLQACQQAETEASIRFFQDAIATASTAGLCVFYSPTWLAFENIDRELQWQLHDLQRCRAHLESVKGQAERRGYDLPNAQKALRSLAFVYCELGMKGEAESLYLKLLEWTDRRYGRDAIEVISRVQDLAWFYFNQGRVESIEYDSECLRLAELHQGQASREAKTAHYFLGESYTRHGQLAMARRHFESARQ